MHPIMSDVAYVDTERGRSIFYTPARRIGIEEYDVLATEDDVDRNEGVDGTSSMTSPSRPSPVHHDGGWSFLPPFSSLMPSRTIMHTSSRHVHSITSYVRCLRTERERFLYYTGQRCRDIPWNVTHIQVHPSVEALSYRGMHLGVARC